MTSPERASWLINSGGADTFVLYVRDALGIDTPTATAIPPLTPPVARIDAELPDGFAADWDRWWTGTLNRSGTRPAGLPEQLHAAHLHWSSAADTAEGRDRTREAFSATLYDLINELKTELGHEPVFTLSLLELPVRGQFWRRIDGKTVLVSTELLRSRNIIAPLESVIRELAGLQ